MSALLFRLPQRASGSTTETSAGSLPLRGWSDRSFENSREGHGETSRLSLRYVSSGSAMIVAINCEIFQARVKEIGTWSIHISSDLESNDSDDDRDFKEHRSINENVDPNETLDDFVKQMVEDEDVIKASAQGHQSDDFIPPDIKKDVAINDEATPRVVNSGDFSSSGTVKDEHIVTHKEKFSEEDVSDISNPPGFENFVKENKECSRSSNSSRSGKCFTSFCNYKRKELKGGSKMSKLDRFLLSDDVIQDIPNLQVVALDRVWSNRNPILLHSKKYDFGPIPFKIFNYWFDRLDFEDAVKEKWAAIQMKNQLRDLKKMDNGDASNEDKTIRINRLQELDNLEKIESVDLVQNARVKWEGVWISELKDIKEVFLNFDKDKFSCHDSLISFPPLDPTHQLNTSDRDFLDAMVSMDEIKTAVWDCGCQKAPGPDDYSFMFIKFFWDISKHDVQVFVVNFFSTRTFPQGFNSAFITLIPKVSNPLFIKDYRPIYLIGIHYKIIAKILANRLLKVIDSIISPRQSSPNKVLSDLVSRGVTSLNISSTKHKERPIKKLK
ncbi:hypothetical protein Tco_0910091 [Tanacetum coccineum]|uniref:Uncharacterized protein n=1 Tax=Tanacetum coccineum TaxID=301880 RepID=A0ABQ5CRX5_9ASTR